MPHLHVVGVVGLVFLLVNLSVAPPAADVCANWATARVTAAVQNNPGPVGSCDPGSITAEAQAEGLRATNYYRYLSNLPPTATNPNWVVGAQQSARLMDANQQLAHTMPSTWICYAALPAGVNASAKSNLAAGRPTMRQTITQWIQDSPTVLGHRFWLMHPLLPYATFGFSTGYYSTGGAYRYYSAGQVMPRNGEDGSWMWARERVAATSFVATPFEYVPREAFDPLWVWSVIVPCSTTGTGKWTWSVTVTDTTTGAPMPTTNRLEAGNPYCFSTTNCIGFQMIGFNVTGAVPDRRYNVQVVFTGFTTINYYVQILSTCGTPTTLPPTTVASTTVPPTTVPPTTVPPTTLPPTTAAPTPAINVTYGLNTVAMPIAAKAFALFHPQAVCPSGGACDSNVTVIKPVSCTTATCNVSLDVLANIPAGSGYVLRWSNLLVGGTWTAWRLVRVIGSAIVNVSSGASKIAPGLNATLTWTAGKLPVGLAGSITLEKTTPSSSTLQTWLVASAGSVASQLLTLALPSNTAGATAVATDLNASHRFCISVPSALASSPAVSFCSTTFLLARPYLLTLTANTIPCGSITYALPFTLNVPAYASCLVSATVNSGATGALVYTSTTPAMNATLLKIPLNLPGPLCFAPDTYTITVHPSAPPSGSVDTMILCRGVSPFTSAPVALLASSVTFGTAFAGTVPVPMRMGSLYSVALSWTNLQSGDFLDVSLVSIFNSTTRIVKSTVQSLVSYQLRNSSASNVNVVVNATLPYQTSQMSLTGAFALAVTLRSVMVSVTRQFVSRGITPTAPVVFSTVPAWTKSGALSVALFVGNGIPDSDRPSFLITAAPSGLSLLAGVLNSSRTAPDTASYTLDVPSAFASSNVTLSVGAFDASKNDRGIYPQIQRQFVFAAIAVNITSPPVTPVIWYKDQTYTITITTNDPFSTAETCDVYLVDPAGTPTWVKTVPPKTLSIPVRVPMSLFGGLYRVRLVWKHSTLTSLPTYTKEGGNVTITELVRFFTSPSSELPVTWQPGMSYAVNWTTGRGVAATTLINFYLWDEVTQNGIQLNAPVAMGAVGGAVMVQPRFVLSGTSWTLAAKIAMAVPSVYRGQRVTVGAASVQLVNNGENYRAGQVIPLKWQFAPGAMLAADKHDLWVVRPSTPSVAAASLATARVGNALAAYNWTSPLTFVTAAETFSVAIVLSSADLVQYAAAPRLVPTTVQLLAGGSLTLQPSIDLTVPSTAKPGPIMIFYAASSTAGAPTALLTFTLKEIVNGTALPLTLSAKSAVNATSVPIYIPTYAGGKSFKLAVTNAAAVSVYLPPTVLSVSAMNWGSLFSSSASYLVRAAVPFAMSFDWASAGYSTATGPASLERFAVQLVQNNSTYVLAKNNLTLSSTYTFAVPTYISAALAADFGASTFLFKLVGQMSPAALATTVVNGNPALATAQSPRFRIRPAIEFQQPLFESWSSPEQWLANATQTVSWLSFLPANTSFNVSLCRDVGTSCNAVISAGTALSAQVPLTGAVAKYHFLRIVTKNAAVASANALTFYSAPFLLKSARVSWLQTCPNNCLAGQNVLLRWNSTDLSLFPLSSVFALYISDGMQRWTALAAVNISQGATGVNYTLPAWLSSSSSYFLYLELPSTGPVKLRFRDTSPMALPASRAESTSTAAPTRSKGTNSTAVVIAVAVCGAVLAVALLIVAAAVLYLRRKAAQEVAYSSFAQ